MERNRDAEGLQVAASPEKQTYHESPAPEAVWHGKQGVNTPLHPHQKQTSDSSSGRIFGLRRATFWFLVVLALLVIAGAVGGGVAGGLLSRDNGRDDDQLHVGMAATPAPTNQSSSSETLPVTTTSATTEPLDTATSTSSAPVTTGTTGLAENPCPAINGSTPEASSHSSFAVLCGVDWPRGIDAADGDGEVRDLSRTTAYTLQDCVDACVEENGCKAVTYESNLTASFGGGQDGNCFFKDRAGKYFEGKDTTIAAGIIGA